MNLSLFLVRCRCITQSVEALYMDCTRRGCAVLLSCGSLSAPVLAVSNIRSQRYASAAGRLRKENYPTGLMYHKNRMAGKECVRQANTSSRLSGLSEAHHSSTWSAPDDSQLPKPRACAVASAQSNIVHVVALDQVALPFGTDCVVGTASAQQLRWTWRYF